MRPAAASYRLLTTPWLAVAVTFATVAAAALPAAAAPLSADAAQTHWSFRKPVQPEPPTVRHADWPRNAIDRFVLARLEAQGLSPSQEADRYTLVRRVYLDLIGLPPTPPEADAFVHDDDPHAYEHLVDRLLDSPHYGERWARRWLDVARYADTNGYEKDRPRSTWPYRDWVIHALNADMPFDQFTVEQLAGDMLPGATADERIATGFHRNTMLNEEGGIDPLEYRFYAMVDRVATTGVVWLGLTTGCAQCHSHKYDPITQTDYYRLMAFLNNADEPDMAVPDPVVAQRREQLEQQIAHLEADLPNQFPPAEGDGPVEQRRRQRLDASFAAWIEAQRPAAHGWTVLKPFDMKTNLPRLEVLDDGSIFSSGDITKRDVYTLRFHTGDVDGPITALRLEALPDNRLPAGGPGRCYYEGRKGDFFLSEVKATADGKPVRFADASHSYGKISIGSGNAKATNVFDGEGSTGWSTAEGEGRAHQLVVNLAEPLTNAGELVIEMVFERHYAASLGRFRFAATTAATKPVATQTPVEIEALLAGDPSRWTDDQRGRVLGYYLSVAPELAAPRKQIDEIRRQMPQFPTTLVMQERPADNPRPTHLHHRGEYLQPEAVVEPGLPSMFAGTTPPQDRPTNRLAFARWLVSEDNPLAARVTVNREWQAFFGSGIVATLGDLGTQGAAPTHPQLLDWLACQFVKQGWSLKRLHRLIVTSATYRQRSDATAKLLALDPQNRLLSRGPRFRVEAEVVRDSMLRASGLLTEKLGGPSVYPPQPASVTELAYGNMKWHASAGPDRYRRSLYTFSKRTAPFAAYTVFDAPTGENCVARRDRSNTPLQALTLLNDEMFMEMARALAKQAMAETSTETAGKTAAGAGNDGGRTDKSIATAIFRRVLVRPPTDAEAAALVDFQHAQLARLRTGELKPTDICADKSASPEQAAWTMVARVVMNLDEAVTKP
jgi:Protein of unknown function (DUF1553)/Protein of unknown function (DUF1549)